MKLWNVSFIAKRKTPCPPLYQDQLTLVFSQNRKHRTGADTHSASSCVQMVGLVRGLFGSERRRKYFQQEEARYTVIFHKPRKDLRITINEYCLADTIQKLSGNRSGVPGWCYAKKEHLARSLGFSRQSIHSILTQCKMDVNILLNKLNILKILKT